MFDWWLKHCERRPWWSFLQLWCFLIVGLLLLGFAGFRHLSQPDIEPPKELVDYRAFLPGGPSSYEFKLQVDDLFALPQYDANLERRKNVNGLSNWISGPRLAPAQDGSATRLVCDRPIFEGRFGWPLLLAEWRRFQAWDVTDPFAEHFQHARSAWTGDWRSTVEHLAWQMANDEGSRITGFDVHVAALVAELLFAEYMAALLVAMNWLIGRSRTRRRIREGRCLACGHALGPSPRPLACPECAQPANEAPPRHHRSRFGRIFLVALLVATLALICLSFLLGERKGPSEFAERQAQLLASNQADVNQSASSFWFWNPQQSASYGLGSVVHYVRGQWLLLAPNATPAPGIHPRISTGLDIDPNSNAIAYEWIDSDDLSWSSVRLNWRLAAMQLAGIQVAVFASTLIAAVTTRMWRRRAL